MGAPTAPETAWAFDSQVYGTAEYGGYPVITPQSGIAGGVSYVGPEHAAITVNPETNPYYYAHLEDTARGRLRSSDAEPRAAVARAVSSAVLASFKLDEAKFAGVLQRSGSDQHVIDLSTLIERGVGDERTLALAAGFLLERLMPDANPHVDQKMGEDGRPRAWVRYHDLTDYSPDDFLAPLATVVLDPAHGVADTLWATRGADGRSPYARPADERNIAQLVENNRRYPVVTSLIRELGRIDSTATPRAAFLIHRMAELAADQ